MRTTRLDLPAFTQPDIEPIGHQLYRLRHDFQIVFEHPKTLKCYKLIVPKNFEYDGATVFSIFTVLSRGKIARDGQNRAAALVHDWMYRMKGKLKVEPTYAQGVEVDITLTRMEVERVFYDVLIRSDVPKKQSKQMYDFVKWFAWVKWI